MQKVLISSLLALTRNSYTIMNRQTQKARSVILLTLILATSACGSRAPLPTPQPVTATQTSAVLEPSPYPVESATAEMTVVVEQTVPAPSGLRIAYLREGNLWSWTEADSNVMLTDTGDMTTARLSDDGQLLAFMRGPEVWTVRMDGMDARLLVTQRAEGGALWFAPDGSLLSVSTADHIDLIDLKNGKSTTVVSYPAIPKGYYPEIVWAADSTGFKTVIPASTEKGQAEFLFVLANGTKASLAKFSMVSPSESAPFISPDGGYVIYVAKLNNGQDSLHIMDSSGATKPYGEPAEDIRAYGWLADSKHFTYASENQNQTFLGDVTGIRPMEVAVTNYETVRWADAERFLATQDNNLYLGDINGGKTLIAEGVSDFDFAK